MLETHAIKPTVFWSLGLTAYYFHLIIIINFPRNDTNFSAYLLKRFIYNTIQVRFELAMINLVEATHSAQ